MPVLVVPRREPERVVEWEKLVVAIAAVEVRPAENELPLGRRERLRFHSLAVKLLVAQVAVRPLLRQVGRVELLYRRFHAPAEQVGSVDWTCSLRANNS